MIPVSPSFFLIPAQQSNLFFSIGYETNQILELGALKFALYCTIFCFLVSAPETFD